MGITLSSECGAEILKIADILKIFYESECLLDRHAHICHNFSRYRKTVLGGKFDSF